MELKDWHHLMGMALNDFFSGTSYEVRVEEDISKKKQILDVLIVRRGEGNPPDELPDGFEELAAHNLLSYKSMLSLLTDGQKMSFSGTLWITASRSARL